MKNSKASTLIMAEKNYWFDCHYRFLPMDYKFRRMKNAFDKNKIENDPPPPLLSGHHIWKRVCSFPKVIDDPPSTHLGYGVEHNWTK